MVRRREERVCQGGYGEMCQQGCVTPCVPTAGFGNCLQTYRHLFWCLFFTVKSWWCQCCNSPLIKGEECVLQGKQGAGHALAAPAHVGNPGEMCAGTASTQPCCVNAERWQVWGSIWCQYSGHKLYGCLQACFGNIFAGCKSLYFLPMNYRSTGLFGCRAKSV